MYRTLALAATIAAMGCVPNGDNPVAYKAAPTDPVVVASAEPVAAVMDYRGMEADIRPSEGDGRIFEYY